MAARPTPTGSRLTLPELGLRPGLEDQAGPREQARGAPGFSGPLAASTAVAHGRPSGNRNPDTRSARRDEGRGSWRDHRPSDFSRRRLRRRSADGLFLSQARGQAGPPLDRAPLGARPVSLFLLEGDRERRPDGPAVARRTPAPSPRDHQQHLQRREDPRRPEEDRPQEAPDRRARILQARAREPAAQSRRPLVPLCHRLRAWVSGGPLVPRLRFGGGGGERRPRLLWLLLVAGLGLLRLMDGWRRRLRRSGRVRLLGGRGGSDRFRRRDARLKRQRWRRRRGRRQAPAGEAAEAGKSAAPGPSPGLRGNLHPGRPLPLTMGFSALRTAAAAGQARFLIPIYARPAVRT
jgi:hypothetical protein